MLDKGDITIIHKEYLYINNRPKHNRKMDNIYGQIVH